MKLILKPFSVFVLLNVMGLPVSASSFVTVGISQTVIEHGGGCRKSSPPGQCCHGGSKPVHCH